MLKKSKKITDENEIQLIIKAKNGDIKARNQVIENNLALIQKVAKKTIVSSNLSDNDLIQEGIFGLITAIEKFNPKLGFKFATYAVWWIKQAMYKAISTQSYAYNIPVYIQETLSRYKKTKQELEQIEQKEVTKKEIAKKMNLTEEKIDTFLNVFNHALSIESGVSLTQNKELTLSEIIEDEKQNVEKNVIDAQLKTEIKLALENLKEKEKSVIILRFGLEDKQKQTLEEIGNNFGITKECVRQIQNRALNKIATSELAKNSLINYIH